MTIGKSGTATSMAAACAVYGTYKSVQAFVPGVASNTGDMGHSAPRRDIAENIDSFPVSSISDSNSLAATIGMTTFATISACAAVARQNGRARASTVKQQAAIADVEAPPAPVFDPAMQPGAMAPLGFFDPLGFCKKGDEAGFRNFRSAEIKHGRVAMMAAVGAVFQHYIQFPGFQDIPKGLAAVSFGPGFFGFATLFFMSGVLELGPWQDNPRTGPGDFGNPLSSDYGPDGKPVPVDDDLRNRELNNGRMAMFSILGIMSAELLTGKDAIEQFGF